MVQTLAGLAAAAAGAPGAAAIGGDGDRPAAGGAAGMTGPAASGLVALWAGVGVAAPEAGAAAAAGSEGLASSPPVHVCRRRERSSRLQEAANSAVKTTDHVRAGLQAEASALSLVHAQALAAADAQAGCQTPTRLGAGRASARRAPQDEMVVCGKSCV